MCGYRHGILQASHNSISPPCETPRHLNSNVFVAHMTNPLLTERALNVLPLFDQIQPSHVEAALDEVLAANRSQLARIVGAEGAPDWQSLVEPLDEMNESRICSASIPPPNGVRPTTPVCPRSPTTDWSFRSPKPCSRNLKRYRSPQDLRR